MHVIQKNAVPLQPLKKKHSGCSAVGSALRSGRRGRAFESPHPDRNGDSRLNKSAIFFSDCEALRFLLRSYRQLLLIVVRLGC